MREKANLGCKQAVEGKDRHDGEVDEHQLGHHIRSKELQRSERKDKERKKDGTKTLMAM